MNGSGQNIRYFHVDETDSTNLEIARIDSLSREDEALYVLSADYQTSGRGQKGSSWESERGSNLLFSVMLWPRGVDVHRQFRLSQAMALAVCGALNAYLSGSSFSEEQGAFRIKWPNDIYYKERKISGTIIETIWRGQMVDRCILGIGINVNQARFMSPAPNPVSLCQILGAEADREALLRDVMARFATELEALYTGGEDSLAKCYEALLIWRDGMHTYRDAEGEFQAELLGVESDGHMVLRDADGRQRRYMFKEVKHIFNTLECD